MSDAMDAARTYATGTSRATSRGTPIRKPGEDMDKNAFLKILSAELGNQDPDNKTDSTQYVAQLAQFSSLEQMQNLSTTMTNSSNNSLLGKAVTLNKTDQAGNLISGIIRSVTNSGTNHTISVEYNNNGKNDVKDFDVSDIKSTLYPTDYSLQGINNIYGNSTFSLATSFIGTDVEATDTDSNNKSANYSGRVVGVVKDNGVVKVNVRLTNSTEIKQFTLDKINKVELPTDTATPKTTNTDTGN